MSQNAGTCLFARSGFDLLRHRRTNATEPRFPIFRRAGGGDKVAPLFPRTFSDHDDRKLFLLFFALPNLVADGVVTKRDFGNQNDVGSAGNPGE